MEEVQELSAEEKTSEAIIPVVGIGASAGGLEVFKRLLGNLPADTGFAFVVVQHLSPNHPSMLAEILARATAMPVAEATDGLVVEADHVYVIPSGLDLTMARGTLKLAPRVQSPGTHMPIDRFFRSLADQCGSRTVGIILSGTGSDGSAGVEAIKSVGGVTFAQEGSSAKFAAMPESAVATDCVDFVLPPEEIAVEVARIGRHPYIANALTPLPEPASETPIGKEDAAQITGILAVLREATGIDFSQYRQKMIKRRILRRLALRNVNSLAEYCARLKKDADEVKALQRDLLISVTSFFRDPESFECLKTVVYPRLLKDRGANDTIRVWVAGCATGEEAFSMAISLQEYLKETGSTVPVQIFASDVGLDAIEKARRGRFLENIAEDVTEERLNRCFTKVEGGYQINKDLREMCVFTRHNLIDDPPFSKLDMICCRNVLIYLGSVRHNIIPLFHYALKPGGFLMLGAAEATASDELFSVVDVNHRIFGRVESARRPLLFPRPGGARREPPHARDSATRAAAPATAAPELWDSADQRKEVDRILLAKYSMASVVVDQDLNVVEIRGKANRYLTLPVGRISFNLIKLIPDTAMFLEVEKLIQQARKTGESARKECIPYENDGNSGDLRVEVLPLNAGRSGSAMVLFEPAPIPAQPPAEATPGDGDIRDRQIARLKQQLAEAKEHFLTAIESQETSKEESQSTTEEALSANEELQSLNEELETAKEELQSTNQELITVNDELQAKNAMLAQARDFAMSIVETVRQPLLVLDMDLRIKMANQAFFRTFQVSPQEAEGRIVYSLSRGSWDLPGLRDALARLVREEQSFPDFEVQQEFPALGRRTLVLGGCRLNPLKKILLAIDDITDRKLAQQALRKSEEHLRESQKMEAVGRLAGGIAHDFNNLLTCILGYSDLLQDTLAGNEKAIEQVLEIKVAGERAAALTQQLLAFGRRQVLQPKVVDLNVILEEFDKMLRRLVGESIAVSVDCAPDLWQVIADPGEIGRAIMNLWLNARDAMPNGGTLTVETANLTLTAAEGAGAELPPGRYVMMAIHDTGVGMSAEMQSHIFEPFFTTKDVGKGTGLGLATVLGIVEQSGGVIHCESKLGQGTTFKILLPAVAQRLDQGTSAASLGEAPKGCEVILLVEDEATIRKLARMVLQALGYTVLEAGNGREGLVLCEIHQGKIDLIVSDVMMPELGGREMAQEARKLRPNIKVLFLSGHIQDVVLREGVRKGTAFLQKPFTAQGLGQKVREVLDEDATKQPG